MKINQDKIDNPAALPIESIEVINDNNFSFKFYNYGGYIHEVNIPYLNSENKTEDVLLGYGDVDGVLNSNGYFNDQSASQSQFFTQSSGYSNYIPASDGYY